MAKQNTNSKKAAAKRTIKQDLKKAGLRLPHGYEISIRKRK